MSRPLAHHVYGKKVYGVSRTLPLQKQPHKLRNQHRQQLHCHHHRIISTVDKNDKDNTNTDSGIINSSTNRQRQRQPNTAASGISLKKSKSLSAPKPPSSSEHSV